MRKLLFILFASALLASCSTLHQTATQKDVSTPIISAVISDLDVSDNKISYTYEPTRQVRKGGVQNCINSAIAEALKGSGGDVLVETQKAIVERRGLFVRKISKITVTGYPAKYKNFRNASEESLNKVISRGYVIDDTNSRKSGSWSVFNFLK